MKAKKIFEFKENIQNLGIIFLNKLEDFINSTIRNEWIFSPGIRMYVRKSKRYYNGKFIDCLDLASVETEEYGTGLFTYVFEQILEKYKDKNIFLESILNDRLYNFFLKYGFESFGELNLIKFKTTKISENFHFERGKSPFDSLKIGLKYKRHFKTHKEAARIFLDNIKVLSDGRWNSLEEFKDTWEKFGILQFLKSYLEGFDGKYSPLFIDEEGSNFNNAVAKLNFLKKYKDTLKSILYGDEELENTNS